MNASYWELLQALKDDGSVCDCRTGSHAMQAFNILPILNMLERCINKIHQQEHDDVMIRDGNMDA